MKIVWRRALDTLRRERIVIDEREVVGGWVVEENDLVRSEVL